MSRSYLELSSSSSSSSKSAHCSELELELMLASPLNYSEILTHKSMPRRHSPLPLLLLLFVGSGACALIYEVVWFQLLELVVGSSAISIGVLLATYMGGMCIGSLALPRFVPVKRHPL